MTQIGTTAPTASVLQNTIGATVTYSYTSPGQYYLIAATGGTGVLTNNKTWVIFNNVGPNGTETYTYNGKSQSGFAILTRSGSSTTDNLLNSTEIEIRVYN